MRVLQGIGNLVLVIMAAASLIAMIAALSVDNMVNGSLYSYGLHFNYGWYIPYEAAMGIVFAMSWVNIIVAIAFEVYRLRSIRKDET